jgi:hypothetical protein
MSNHHENRIATEENAMKILVRAGLLSALLALPFTASAQTDTTPKADAAPKATGGMMMNCPMMTDMGGMQKDLGLMMGDVEGMTKDAKDPATKETLQKMHDRMAAMMVNMQKMGGMMGNMMGGRATQSGQQPGSAAPAAPATPPASPEDHQAHHPGTKP